MKSLYTFKLTRQLLCLTLLLGAVARAQEPGDVQDEPEEVIRLKP